MEMPPDSISPLEAIVAAVIAAAVFGMMCL